MTATASVMLDSFTPFVPEHFSDIALLLEVYPEAAKAVHEASDLAEDNHFNVRWDWANDDDPTYEQLEWVEQAAEGFTVEDPHLVAWEVKVKFPSGHTRDSYRTFVWAVLGSSAPYDLVGKGLAQAMLGRLEADTHFVWVEA